MENIGRVENPRHAVDEKHQDKFILNNGQTLFNGQQQPESIALCPLES